MNTKVHQKLRFPCFVIKGCCVTLNNYYNSPELANAFLSCNTDCCSTIQKKQGLPNQFWEWGPPELRICQNQNPKAELVAWDGMMHPK